MAHIAIIEDERILRELIAGELERQGYEVSSAGDGASGWEMIKKVKPDLILLDLLMPIMTGYEVLQKLRADALVKEIPCIVISNSGHTDDLSRAYKDGANDVLIKANFNPEQVVEKVAELLAGKKAE